MKLKFLWKMAIFIALFTSALYIEASDVEDLKIKLSEREEQIKELENEIEKYKGDVSKTNKEVRSLDTEINGLNAVISKLQADIKITERRIDFSNLTIEKINIDTARTELTIQRNQALIADLLRKLDEMTSQTLVEILLANNSISGFFDNVKQIEDIQETTKDQLDKLRADKRELVEELGRREEEKSRHLQLKEELGDRKIIEAEARNEKSYLLKVTKKKESEYKTLLGDRVKKKAALEDEIRAIEEEIRVTIDPSILPSPSSGILGFPLPEVSLKSCLNGGTEFDNCVTQFFGNTAFATQNPQVYSGNGHNGIDFRAAIGTEVFSSYGGKVRAVGNTDDQCRGVSYGRWILIDHLNGLSTLYTHLSRSVILSGSEVKKGERIGYTGQTGYATGPHLHYAVFATQAVQVTSLNPSDKYYYKSRICGTPLYMPISPPNGYLNPLSYL